MLHVADAYLEPAGWRFAYHPSGLTETATDDDVADVVATVAETDCPRSFPLHAAAVATRIKPADARRAAERIDHFLEVAEKSWRRAEPTKRPIGVIRYPCLGVDPSLVRYRHFGNSVVTQWVPRFQGIEPWVRAG